MKGYALKNKTSKENIEESPKADGDTALGDTEAKTQ